MAPSWIVDANNVMGSRPDGWWRDRPAALGRLVDEIIRWRAEAGEPVVVVADGHPTNVVPEGEAYGVEVRYAHSGSRDAADDVIVRAVESVGEPAAVTVVTSDRALQARIGKLGAGIEGARTFLHRLGDIETRRSDREVLDHFGIDESALLGRGGEARVFALDDERVLRLAHPGSDPAELEARRRMLDAIASDATDFEVPRVLEHYAVAGRAVVIERRLPGRNAMRVLAEPGTDRAALVRDHLDVARRIAALPCPARRFGELWGDGAIVADTFAEWAEARVAASLRVGGEDYRAIDAAVLTRDLVDALPEPEPDAPKLVHLDAFLGNMLAAGDGITAVLDFGPMTVGGPPELDALVAVAYLAPEITPVATDDDRAVARAWAQGAGLEDALTPAERWIAAYWAGAPGDEHLRRWCVRILLGTT